MNFDKVIRLLAVYINNTADAVYVSDRIMDMVPAAAPVTYGKSYPEGVLVHIAKNMPEVLRYINNNRKINAIKELREFTRAGLKDCKDAIESHDVQNAAALQNLRDKLTN